MTFSPYARSRGTTCLPPLRDEARRLAAAARGDVEQRIRAEAAETTIQMTLRHIRRCIHHPLDEAQLPVHQAGILFGRQWNALDNGPRPGGHLAGTNFAGAELSPAGSTDLAAAHYSNALSVRATLTLRNITAQSLHRHSVGLARLLYMPRRSPSLAGDPS